jgi:hypothetical protein
VSAANSARPPTAVPDALEFDLIYAPVALRALLDALPSELAGKTLMWLHTGGVSGNASQLLRYARAGIAPGGVSPP